MTGGCDIKRSLLYLKTTVEQPTPDGRTSSPTSPIISVMLYCAKVAIVAS